MNKLDVTVVEIIGKPLKEYGRWWLQAVVDDSLSEPYHTELIFYTKQECLQVKIGTKFSTYV